MIMTSAVHARIITQEITPADAERRGWRVNVASDKENPDLILFTIWLGDKERTLKKGTTARLVVRDAKRLISTASLGLESRDGKNVFAFSVTTSCLKESRFRLLVLDLPFPSGDLYWIDLQKFHDAQRQLGK